jgi:hypothetical protein
MARERNSASGHKMFIAARSDFSGTRSDEREVQKHKPLIE